MFPESQRRVRCWRHSYSLAALLALPLLVPPLAQAQRHFGPGDERPELEPFEEPEDLEGQRLSLPPIPETIDPDRRRLSAASRVYVAGYRVVGSTAFSEDELAQLTAPYAGRAITSEELLAARDAITRHYVAHGYVTSGAVIPDQDAADGIVTLQAIEGVLVEVEVTDTEGFRPEYFRSRLLREAGTPLDVRALEEVLQRFQRDPRVESVHAALRPGERRGESFLSLSVTEARRWGMGLDLSNEDTPGIGQNGAGGTARLENPLGWGDSLSIFGRRTEGLRDFEAQYTLPFTSRDSTLELRFERSQSDIVSSELDFLDFFTDYWAYGATLKHPLFRSPRQSLWLGTSFSWRKSKTYIFDDVSISLAPGADDGETVASVVRLFQDWTLRSRDQVIAARSTLSLGLDVLGASNEPGQPDGRFFAWLGQAQWARRLPDRFWGSELLARADVQLVDDRLLSLEKFVVGGMRTVRGYHENELVRDNAAVFSLELRVPLLADSLGRPVLQVAPFFDIGHSWDKGGRFRAGPGEDDGESLKTLSRLGLGLRYSPSPNLLAGIYWGGAFRDVPDRGSGAQNYGLHFRMTARSW